MFTGRIAATLDSAVEHLDEIGGGYTHSRLLRAALGDNETVVVKAATDARTAEDVRLEARVLSHFRLDCMPGLITFDDEDPPFLVLEDLGQARWPPPWPSPGRFFDTVESIGKHTAPDWLPPLRDDRLPSWEAVIGKSDAIASTGAVTVEWLKQAAPLLSESAAQVSVEGDRLVHADIWSENVCFTDDRVVLIDWAGAARGNPDFDRAIAAADVFVTTGQLPNHQWPTRRSMSAMLAALKCSAVTLGNPDWATDDWHANQVNDLIWLLRWAAIEHDLPDPGA